MRLKKFAVPLILVLAVALSACAPAGQRSQETPRTMSVTGNAQVYLEPDIAYISIGVHTENENAVEAVASNNAEAQKVIDALVELGVENKDIRTTNFNIFPQQEWGPNNERLGITYIVENTVYVTLREMDKIGQLLGEAVDAGANNIYGIQFDIADKAAALSEARKAAVDNARAQAEELAQAAGVELGDVQSINYYSSYPMPVYDSKAVGGAELTGEVSISPGQLSLSVDVNVVYELR